MTHIRGANQIPRIALYNDPVFNNKYYPFQRTVFSFLLARFTLASGTTVCILAAAVTGTITVTLAPVVMVIISSALRTRYTATMVSIRLQKKWVSKGQFHLFLH